MAVFFLERYQVRKGSMRLPVHVVWSRAVHVHQFEFQCFFDMLAETKRTQLGV